MSKPYYDWGGAGEITTIGKPFYHKDKLVGVVSLDYTLKGIGNTPRDNSIFFNDGFKSYIVIIEYDDGFGDNPGEGFVISHPLKQTESQSTLVGSTISQAGLQIYTSSKFLECMDHTLWTIQYGDTLKTNKSLLKISLIYTT